MDVATQAASTEGSTATAEAPVIPAGPAANGVTEATATQQAPQAQQVDGGVTPPAPEMLTIMGKQIEKSKVPAEFLDNVRDWEKTYTQKTQEYSSARKKAEALDKLTQNQDFQRWYYEQTNPQARQQNQQPQSDPFELTPEKQAELLSDGGKMRSYFEKLATHVMEKVALPAAQAAQYEAKTLRSEQEVSRLAAKYQDFDELNKNGQIRDVMDKYFSRNQSIDLEDAYWLAKRPYVENEAQLAAQQRVQQKVQASTMPPGGGAPSQVKLVPAKGLSFEDKIRISAAAAMRGEKIEFDRSR